MTVMGWLITIDGHELTVWAGTSHNPYGPDHVSDANHCTIISSANEDSSVAEVKKWTAAFLA